MYKNTNGSNMLYDAYFTQYKGHDYNILFKQELLQSNVVRLCPISGHSFEIFFSISTKISNETIFMGPN